MVYYQVSVVVVNDLHLFNRTGMIGRWAEGIKNELVGFSIKEAPSSLASGRAVKSEWTYQHVGPYPPGSMKANISGEALRTGPRTYHTKIVVDVPYAQAVIKGTGRIYAKPQARVPAGEVGGSGGLGGTFDFGRVGMVLPPNLGFKAGVRVPSVSGQRANNFLGRAMVATARKHPSLRGFRAV